MDQARLTSQHNLTGQSLAKREGAARQLLPILNLPDHLNGLTGRFVQPEEKDGGVHLSGYCLVQQTA
jgi:hypothetical protein